MGEPRSSDYRDVRRADEELGGPHERVVEPVEEQPEMAAAVEDDIGLTEWPPRPDRGRGGRGRGDARGAGGGSSGGRSGHVDAAPPESDQPEGGGDDR